MDRNSCLNYFQAFPFWEHMTEEDQDFLLDNIRELHYPAGAAFDDKHDAKRKQQDVSCHAAAFHHAQNRLNHIQLPNVQMRTAIK